MCLLLHTEVNSGYGKIFINPYLFAMDAKLLVKEALAFQELPHHGLTRRQITILTGKHVISTFKLQAAYCIAASVTEKIFLTGVGNISNYDL